MHEPPEKTADEDLAAELKAAAAEVSELGNMLQASTRTLRQLLGPTGRQALKRMLAEHQALEARVDRLLARMQGLELDGCGPDGPKGTPRSETLQ